MMDHDRADEITVQGKELSEESATADSCEKQCAKPQLRGFRSSERQIGANPRPFGLRAGYGGGDYDAIDVASAYRET
jgi:hypothetical protein